jgi:hypothetical protein
MPTIDERIEALTHSLELMKLDQENYDRKQKELDRRERKGRNALLAGIAAYWQALQEPDDDIQS